MNLNKKNNTEQLGLSNDFFVVIIPLTQVSAVALIRPV